MVEGDAAFFGGGSVAVTDASGGTSTFSFFEVLLSVQARTV